MSSSPPPGVPSSYVHGTTAAAPPNLTGTNRPLGESYSAISYPGNRGPFPPSHSTPHETHRYAPSFSPSQSVDAPTSALSSPGTAYSDGRSTHSTPDAPPFEPTKVIYPLVAGSSQTVIRPDLEAKIHKGFFQVDNKWTCYRRNYFSVSCSFSLRPSVPNVPLYLQRPSSSVELVQCFKVLISAKTQDTNGQEGEVRNLVQHTAKRDKATETVPVPAHLQPKPAPSLAMNPVSGGNNSMYGSQSSSDIDWSYPVSAMQAPQQSSCTHTFERIQFQKATANNGKRRAQQQFYHLVVELFAEIATHPGDRKGAELVKIATKQSFPMVVRGRSPGHYKDARRDSSSSLGPGDGSGHLGDGGGRMPPLPPNMGHSTSHHSLMPYDQGQRGAPLRRGGHFRSNINSERQYSSSDSSSSSPSEIEHSKLPGEGMVGVGSDENARSATGFHGEAFGPTASLQPVGEPSFEHSHAQLSTYPMRPVGSAPSGRTERHDDVYRYGRTTAQTELSRRNTSSAHDFQSMEHRDYGMSGYVRSPSQNPYNHFTAMNLGHLHELCS